MKKECCIFCGAEATLYCDGHLGYPPHEAEPDKISAFKPYTCDAPMCDNCTTRAGHFNICLRGKKGGCIHDTTDYCPVCTDLPRTNRRLIYSSDQAAAIRAAHWLSAPTDYQKRNRVIQGGGQQCLDL